MTATSIGYGYTGKEKLLAKSIKIRSDQLPISPKFLCSQMKVCNENKETLVEVTLLK